VTEAMVMSEVICGMARLLGGGGDGQDEV